MNNKLQKTGGESVDIEKITKYLESMNLSSKLTKPEVQQFIEISQAFGLNPFKREIYANKYGDKMSIIVGFETYIKRAERSGTLSGWNVQTTGMVNHADIAKSDITATITIHRKDWEHPFIHSVHFVEYFQNTMIWKTKPITMIKKVAMAQGFRLCFSDELGGMPYTSDEVSSETVTIEAQTIQTDSDAPTTTPAKKSPGRPRKLPPNALTPPEFPHVEIMGDEMSDRIKQASTIAELLQIWNDCPQCQNHPELKELMTERKNQIKMEIVLAKTNEDELWELARTEKDLGILDAIQKQIEKITETENGKSENNDNELF